MSVDPLVEDAVARGDNDALRRILEETCALTGMGFAAVARVTEDRWIAAQVLDKIEFGLKPGSELEIKATICQEIRDSGQRVIIDHVDMDHDWRTHPVPILYGFESYASLPLVLDDGTFFGTFCAIDPEPRPLSAPATIAALETLSARVVRILSEDRA